MNVKQKSNLYSKGRSLHLIRIELIFFSLTRERTLDLTIYSSRSWYLLFQTWGQFMEQELFCIKSFEI